MAACDGLAALYPATPGRLGHALSGHPLLDFSALIDAALRLPPAQVELRRGDGGPGAGFAFAEGSGHSRAALLEALTGGTHWLMLRNPETLPDFAALLAALVDDIAPVVVAATGAIVQPQIFLFVSSPGCHTPIHLDPEYNILFQIAGSKAFSTLLPLTIDADAHVRLHAEGDNLLRWDEAMRPWVTRHRLGPGDALFVPYKVPHFVDVVGDGPSVSLSLTWKSGWIRDQEAAWRMKARLARWGIHVAPPPHWPLTAPLLSATGRLIERLVAR